VLPTSKLATCMYFGGYVGLVALLNAVEEGDPVSIRLLLSDPRANINHVDYSGDNMLILAINKHGTSSFRNFRGQTFSEIVDCFIPGRFSESKVDINWRDQRGRSALWHAVEKENYELVYILINVVDCDLNTPGSSGYTRLACAALKGYCRIIEFFLQRPGIILNYHDSTGISPLRAASLAGQYDTAQLLLNHPSLQQEPPIGSEPTPLQAAIIMDHIDIVYLLLRHKTLQAINHKDYTGSTALIHASKKPTTGVT
jgi:ankyrin repeat protein